MAGFGFPFSPAASARRGLRLMQRVVTNLRQQLHILQENWFSDHTDDFLASCAVVVSSLLPPFAKTIKCKSKVVKFKDTSDKRKVINTSKYDGLLTELFVETGSKTGMSTNWCSFAFEQFCLIFIEGNFCSPEESPAGGPMIFGAEECSATYTTISTDICTSVAKHTTHFSGRETCLWSCKS